MRIVLLCAVLLLVAVGAPAAVVTRAQVHQAVEAFVLAEAGAGLGTGERLEVHTRWPHDVQVGGEAPPALRVRRTSARPLAGPTVLRVAFVVAGSVERQICVTVDVRTFRRVLVARRGAARGEGVGADLVELAERDVTGARSRPFTEVAQVLGKRTRRALQPGDLVTADHLEAVPVVRRGAAVQLVVQTARLQVSSLGEALEDGGVGERIRVRNVDSGRVVRGVVAEAGTVCVP
ncbi:MAG: flagellar basal body P-ring formation chaperone FlgA [Candidatus Latescibacterota bacterium]